MCVTIVQFILVNILDFDARNIFGELQLYYQQEEVRSGIQRMKAFYLEPSYLGFVTVNIFWIRHYLNRRESIFGLNFVFTLIILLLTNSSFAFLAFLCIILFELHQQVQRFPTVIVLGLVFIISSLGYLFFEDILIVLRLTELNFDAEIVSSGLFRVVLPIRIIYQMFQDGYIFGLTFGQFDHYIESMMTFNGYSEKGISNSFFWLIAHFGVLAIFLYTIGFFMFFRLKNRILKSFILLSVINLNNSGAFVTTQYVFVAILMPILIISIYERNINHYSST